MKEIRTSNHSHANARLFGDIHAGAEVIRDSNGKFHTEKIAEIINLMVKKKGGEYVRKKAKELQKIIALKGDEEIDMLVKELSKFCGENLKQLS